MKKTGPPESSQINRASAGRSQLRKKTITITDTDTSKNRFI